MAQPSGSLDPQAKAAIDATRASLEENQLPSSDISRYDLPSDSWQFLLSPPPDRSGHGLAYDATAGRVILFGGWGSGGYLNDTWAYDCATNSWTNRNPTNPPPARAYHALTYETTAGRVILFGGSSSGGYLNDTWGYNYTTNAWIPYNPTNPPPARSGHAMVYDPAGKVMLFGGYNGSVYLNDTWVYDYTTNSWTNRNPTNPPPAHAWHALAYDAFAGREILFGGFSSGGYLNDTWAYSYPTNTWTNRNPTNHPPARCVHALAYDATAGRVILFGGSIGGGYLNDTWAYNFTANSWNTLRLSHSLMEGWNMITVPLVLGDPSPDVAFPAGWPMYAWDALHNMYLGRSQITLVVGVGYWLKVPSAQTLILEGQPNVQTSTSIRLASGWNLIGTPYHQAVAWGLVNVIRGVETKTLDAAKVAGWIGPFYRWTGTSYDSLSNGGIFQSLAGYWMRVFVEGCAIVFPQP